MYINQNNVYMYIYIYVYIYIYPSKAVCTNLTSDPQDDWIPRFSPPMPMPVMMRATIKAFSHHANIPWTPGSMKMALE